MGYQLQQDPSAQDFLDHIESLLYKNEEKNSLLLGLATRLKGNSEAKFFRMASGGKTVAGALKAAHPNLVLSDGDPLAMEFLANEISKLQVPIPSVVGPSEQAEVFAQAWSQKACQKTRLLMGSRIFKIEKVKLPKVEGGLRPAAPAEVDLVTSWLVEFGLEALAPEEQRNFEGFRPHAQAMIDKGNVYVWIVGNKPVSMAQVSRPTKNGISISAVYTPTPLRKNGYASAVVAHLSQKMLDGGRKFCVLYTDLTNSTSNKIYQDIGYYAVGDSKNFIFDSMP